MIGGAGAGCGGGLAGQDAAPQGPSGPDHVVPMSTAGARERDNCKGDGHTEWDERTGRGRRAKGWTRGLDAYLTGGQHVKMDSL